ncbi:MAG: hypothetical protein IKS51_07465 [Erysipelotrichaceae bacterium]|nr:hypothetical protein [Erysipelotrichaceae bacterium]
MNTHDNKTKRTGILLILILLLSIGVCCAYSQDLLDPYIEQYKIAIPLHHQKDPDAVIEDPEPAEGAESTIPVNTIEKKHYDPSLMNGTWISNEDNPTYWEFTFSNPDVTTDDETKTGIIEESDDDRFQYKVTIVSPEGTVVYYLDRADEENARLWLPGSNGKYSGHVHLHLGEPAAEVIDTPSGDNTGKKPSSPLNPLTPSVPSTPSTPDTPSTPPAPDPESGQKGHWEYVQVLVAEAWDEEVLVTAGYWESVLVSEAWDEEVTYCALWGADQKQVYVCNQCGAQFDTGAEANAHIANSSTCGGWHNEYVSVGEEYCKQYDSYTKHHDAVYRDVWHDPVYQTVHHDAIYKTEKIWVND